MTSDRKAEVNRKNALKSTGPKTLEGKTAVRLNAVKHGLLAEEILLPGEDEAALRKLGDRLRTELQPVGELENMLVDRIISAHWRLRRLGRVEDGIFTYKYYGTLSDSLEMEGMQEANTTMLGNAFVTDANEGNAFSKLSRYETAIERSLFKSLHELQRLQAARQAESTLPPPVAVDVEVSGVSREDV
jgi:hypothetical protein